MTRRNIVFIVMLITVALAVLAVQTVWVGINLALCSIDVVEASDNASEYPEIRANANTVYENVSETRDIFYNSHNPYIKWLSNMNNNLVRFPFALLVIASPFLFVLSVRKYNLSRRAKKARV